MLLVIGIGVIGIGNKVIFIGVAQEGVPVNVLPKGRGHSGNIHQIKVDGIQTVGGGAGRAPGIAQTGIGNGARIIGPALVIISQGNGCPGVVTLSETLNTHRHQKLGEDHRGIGTQLQGVETLPVGAPADKLILSGQAGA